MENQAIITAIRLVWPEFAVGGLCGGRRRDGRRVLRERALVRALSLQFRVFAYGVLAVSSVVMFAAASSTAAVAVLVVASILGMFEASGGPPMRQRPPRIVGDARSLLLNKLVKVPDAKRAGRIVRTQPELDIPSLPPDRPRTRISERRPGPQDDSD
ncbi:MAG: hypothetical protein ACM3L9_04530 [Deltaproteobacteria bacterium]